jgi:hypothetical protein
VAWIAHSPYARAVRVLRGTLLVGVIWAAWHMPILLFADYNSGTPWWFAISCFCVLTIGLSVILTWFRLLSNSVWPCAILHASHNAYIQVFFTPLTGSRGRFTAYVIDEFGIAVPLVAALFAFGFWLDRGRAIKHIPIGPVRTVQESDTLAR